MNFNFKDSYNNKKNNYLVVKITDPNIKLDCGTRLA